MPSIEPKKVCFIVGPIGAKNSPARKRSDKVRRFIIDPAMTGMENWEIVRADDVGKPGMIDRQIITRLRDADLVIADLATANPNAFYEIGIRHMIGKPTVHIQENTETIPFDVSLYSSVMYSLDSVEEIDAAVEELRKHITDAIDPEHEIDNPVTRTLGHEEYSPKPLPEAELLRAEIESVKDQVTIIFRGLNDGAFRSFVGGMTPATPTRFFRADADRTEEAARSLAESLLAEQKALRERLAELTKGDGQVDGSPRKARTKPKR